MCTCMYDIMNIPMNQKSLRLSSSTDQLQATFVYYQCLLAEEVGHALSIM